MHRDRTGWISGIVFILLVAILYAWGSYDSLFDRRPGFVYHPESDRIFRIQLAPTLSPHNKWEAFIPLKSLYFGNVAHAEFLGEFTSLLERSEADRTLMMKDPDAYTKKLTDQLEAERRRFTEEIESNNMEFWDIAYVRRFDLDPSEMLSRSHAKLREFVSDDLSEIIAVDVVVIRWSVKKEPANIEVLRGAVLIKGRAAYELNDMGLY